MDGLAKTYRQCIYEYYFYMHVLQTSLLVSSGDTERFSIDTSPISVPSF